MIKNVVKIYPCVLTVLFLAFVSIGQQPKSVEQRLADLERRVSQIEARAGISAIPDAAQQYRASSAASSYPGPTDYRNIPVGLKLINKKFVRGEDEEADGVQFHIQFKNTGTRDITGIDGDMLVKSLGAKQLMDFGMSMSNYIAAGDSLIWPCQVEYDAVDEGHKVVSQSDKGYLIMELKPQKITYSDGTSDTYK